MAVYWRWQVLGVSHRAFMSILRLLDRASLWYLRNKRPTWCHLLFYFTSYVLNMFQALIYPSSGACDCSVELPHWSFCSWFDVCWEFRCGWVGVVSVLQAEACNCLCAYWIIQFHDWIRPTKAPQASEFIFHRKKVLLFSKNLWNAVINLLAPELFFFNFSTSCI